MDRATSVPKSVLVMNWIRSDPLIWKPVFPNLVLPNEVAGSQDRVKCLLDHNIIEWLVSQTLTSCCWCQGGGWGQFNNTIMFIYKLTLSCYLQVTIL